MPLCNHPECLASAKYNYPGVKPAVYCKDHKLEGMKNLRGRFCIVCKQVNATFSLPGEPPRYCKQCSPEGAEDLKSKKCIICKTVSASYGFLGQKPEYCKNCSPEGTTDLSHKKCKICQTVTASYGFLGQKAEYCKNCSPEGTTDLSHKKCIICNSVTATYGIPGQTAEYCKQCSPEGAKDLRSKMCIDCGLHQPSYGFVGGKPQYCKDCSLPGMKDIRSRICIICQDTLANYALPGQKPDYCKNCALAGMEDVKNRRCKSPWCDVHVRNNRYEGYCTFCYAHLYPDKPISKNYKTKESAVVQYIKSIFQDIDIVTDKTIQGGCSQRRPDILIDLGYQIIIVEIDENQHIDYDCSCENKRTMQLSQDVNHRPIVFIRFNPDDYKTTTGNVTSCWSVNKQGVCAVKKCKTIEWQLRLESLKTSIEYWLSPVHKTEKLVETIQLFYDEI